MLTNKSFAFLLFIVAAIHHGPTIAVTTGTSPGIDGTISTGIPATPPPITPIDTTGSIIGSGGTTTGTGGAIVNTSPALTFSVLGTKQFESIGSLVRSGANFVMFGSHHRILHDGDIEHTGTGYWATADYARHDPSSTKASVGEIGLYRDITDRLRIGMGAGICQARQNQPLASNSKLDSRYLVLESDYTSTESRWVASVTGYYGSNRASITRGYMVGPAIDTSTGDPTGSSWAMRLRNDWPGLSAVYGYAVSPYIAYTHTASRLDSYAETGGTLPLTVDAQEYRSNEIRIGTVFSSRLSDALAIRFPLELAYRKNGNATVNVAAAGTGLPSFQIAGNEAGWGRVGAEFDYRLSDATSVNGAVLRASQGGDSSWIASVNLKYSP